MLVLDKVKDACQEKKIDFTTSTTTDYTFYSTVNVHEREGDSSYLHCLVGAWFVLTWEFLTRAVSK